MVKTKKMNEADFAKIVKELTAVAEMIRTRQDEKQSVLDEFDREKMRYRLGKISKKAFDSSVRKVNRELLRLDNGIKSGMKSVNTMSTRIRNFAEKQKPINFVAALAGIRFAASKKRPKKAKPKRKPVKKKAVKKKAGRK